MNKECEYCSEQNVPLSFDDTAFHIEISERKGNYYIYNMYDFDIDHDVYSYNINFCPMCGRKLGDVEVLEVHGQSGKVYYEKKSGDSLC